MKTATVSVLLWERVGPNHQYHYVSSMKFASQMCYLSSYKQNAITQKTESQQATF